MLISDELVYVLVLYNYSNNLSNIHIFLHAPGACGKMLVILKLLE